MTIANKHSGYYHALTVIIVFPGIRARVAAIYEPPQVNTRDGVTLLPDDRESTVEQIAQQLGLQIVGWIFTDLLSEDSSKGTVQHCRSVHVVIARVTFAEAKQNLIIKKNLTDR